MQVLSLIRSWKDLNCRPLDPHSLALSFKRQVSYSKFSVVLPLSAPGTWQQQILLLSSVDNMELIFRSPQKFNIFMSMVKTAVQRISLHPNASF